MNSARVCSSASHKNPNKELGITRLRARFPVSKPGRIDGKDQQDHQRLDISR